VLRERHRGSRHEPAQPAFFPVAHWLRRVILSLCGPAVLAALTPLIGTARRCACHRAARVRLVLYLHGQSGERVGASRLSALWTVAASFAWFLGLPLVAYALVHVRSCGSLRSLYCYSGVLPALADFGLSLLGAAFASVGRATLGRRLARVLVLFFSCRPSTC